MFDYLQQFNNLPKELRDKVSSPEIMSAIAELEKKYQVDLAMAVMKVMIKSAAVKNLPAYFISDLGLSPSDAENLVKDLTAKVFVNVANYLGLEKQIKALDLDADINLIISEAGLVLPSEDLINRFKGILSTYLKGIRSKIAARDAFAKPINFGGLNLSPVEVDRVFKVCEQKTFKSLEVNLATVSKILPPQSRVDKIIASADGASSEYNLKQAIASGQVKKIEIPRSKIVLPDKLDTSHELQSPVKELDLPLLEKTEKQKAEAPVDLPVLVPAASVTVAPIIPVPSVIAPLTASSAAKIKPTINPASTNPASQVSHATPASPAQRINKPAKTGFFGQALKEPAKPELTTPAASPSPKTTPRPIPASRPIFAPSISKQVMHDIKPMPKVMGPLEELQFLDLLNFRRLGKTPSEITEKIFSKIKLLEADGYDRMVAGVRAWRQSPVNHLYLKMVQEAMSKGQTIKDFALNAQKDNKNYLTMEEIEAILAMNSQLVF